MLPISTFIYKYQYSINKHIKFILLYFNYSEKVFTNFHVYPMKSLNIYVSYFPMAQDGPYSWDKELQGVILGSFFWGSLLTQLPGGLIATRFGGKSVILVAMLLNSLTAIFSPLAAEASPYALMALRAIQGLAQVLSSTSSISLKAHL